MTYRPYKYTELYEFFKSIYVFIYVLYVFIERPILSVERDVRGVDGRYTNYFLNKLHEGNLFELNGESCWTARLLRHFPTNNSFPIYIKGES